MIDKWTIASILSTFFICVDNHGLFTLKRNAPDLRDTFPYQNLRRDNLLMPMWLNDSEAFNQEEKSRKERFLMWSYRQSPLVDMVMNSPVISSSTRQQAPVRDRNDFLTDSYPLPKGMREPAEEYDYIIVGGGTSGSVIAARLSEKKPRATVLVLEAGKPEMLLTDIPALVPYLQLTDYSWPYTYEYQPGVCLGSEQKRCFSPRGKALGGSSVTNYMIYSRGRPETWNNIAADGNHGWAYQDLLKYFTKSENFEVKKRKKIHNRGIGGEMSVGYVPFRTGLAEAFLKAGRSFGYPTIDYNVAADLGFGHVQVMMNKGHRMSTAKAFLHPNKRRKNLHILTEARVTSVVIDAHIKRAYAVKYIKYGIKYTVRCRREIILAAGPIASPQILMLSGVGAAEKLSNFGIPVISDLRVGYTLYDHIAFPGVIFRLNSTNASLLEPKIATVTNLMQWLQFGDGLLTSPGAVEALGYVKTSQSREQGLLPDIELVSLGGSINMDDGGAFRKSAKITDEIYSAFNKLNGFDTWSAIPVLLQPKSKGRLELRDTNPLSYPKIYGNFLNHRQDMATLIEAVKYVIRLGESEPFRKYGAKLFYPSYPTCGKYLFGTDQYWECAIRTLMVSARHIAGTCKMGPASDPEAVVDPELRVYGVDGLRVADSSIIPRPISAHLQAPLIMIGEKAADMITRAWVNVKGSSQK